jgi:hypothetical protein|tara:strand:+ start:2067 stop:2249 length:183 start_codon:yes stop_codon:yes gene_type:complete
MATVSRAKARENGEPLPHYERPEGWLPHFLRVDAESWREGRDLWKWLPAEIEEEPKNSEK